MPRVARFKIAAIGDLCRQLMYAPAEARRRQLDAAEQLVSAAESLAVHPGSGRGLSVAIRRILTDGIRAR